jgi:hypothetical protein
MVAFRPKTVPQAVNLHSGGHAKRIEALKGPGKAELAIRDRHHFLIPAAGQALIDLPAFSSAC